MLYVTSLNGVCLRNVSDRKEVNKYLRWLKIHLFFSDNLSQGLAWKLPLLSKLFLVKVGNIHKIFK